MNVLIFLLTLQNKIKVMETIRLELKESKVSFYNKYLNIVNAILPTNMTNKEIEILATFLSLDKHLTEEDMFNSVTRKLVMDKLKLKPGGLGNHLKHLIEKKILTKNDITGRIKMKSFLYPNEPSQIFNIKLIKEND